MTPTLIVVDDPAAFVDPWDAADRRALARLLRMAGRVAAGRGLAVRGLPTGGWAWRLAGGPDGKRGPARFVLSIDDSDEPGDPRRGTTTIALRAEGGDRTLAAIRLSDAPCVPTWIGGRDRRGQVGEIAGWARTMLDAAADRRVVARDVVEDAARALVMRGVGTAIIDGGSLRSRWTPDSPWRTREGAMAPGVPAHPRLVRARRPDAHGDGTDDADATSGAPTIVAEPATTRIAVGRPFDPVARIRAEASLSRLTAMAEPR